MEEKSIHFFKRHPVIKLSIGMNSLVAIGKLIIGIVTLSIFMIINSLYNLGVAGAKYSSLAGKTDKQEKGEEYYYRRVGKIILFISAVYIFYALRLFIEKTTVVYSQSVAIGIAAITFFEISFNLYGYLKVKNKDRLSEANRLINLASSMIGLVLTQTALLSFASKEDHSFVNGVAGILFGCIAATIGIFMIHSSDLRIKKDEKGNHKI